MKYLYAIHREALSGIYGFAGRLRMVNMYKGVALFLSQSLERYEKDMLFPLNEAFATSIRSGRATDVPSRLFTELVFLYHTGEQIDFPAILKENRHEYSPSRRRRKMNTGLWKLYL